MDVNHSEPRNGHLDRILVKNDRRMLLIDTERVAWIESDGNYVELHADEGSHRIRARIRDLEERLDPHRFMRIHRSAIVNLDRIDEIVREESGGLRIVLDCGDRVRLSRSYRARFEDRFGIRS